MNSDSVFVQTAYDGHVFVPSKPIDLPLGTTLGGIVKPPLSQEGWLAFLDSVEGAWGDYDVVDP